MVSKKRFSSRLMRAGLYGATILIVAGATTAVSLLRDNIAERQEEGKQHTFRVVDVDENTIDAAIWGKNYPRQFDSYKRTAEMERTRYGGSASGQKHDTDPHLRLLFAGYAYSIDYRHARGHAYMLIDQDLSERVKRYPQPGACVHCHSSVLPLYREAGRKAGVSDDRPQEQIFKGFEEVCARPFDEMRKMVDHPVSCVDCHDPQSMQLRVTRPGFLRGIAELARSDADVPHLPSIGQWRKGARDQAYDVNAQASRQEMRSMVCGQCHVEYYFKEKGKLLTYPWHKGLKVEQIENYFEEVSHTDWTHAASGAKLLKAQHPEFETWSQGIHARSGVSCADCHMPYKREGAIKVSDHHIRSPLLNVARACQTCHRYSESEILARAHSIQDRTADLKRRAQEAVVDLIKVLEQVQKEGTSAEQLQGPRQLHRKAQWRLDFVSAENSMGFHAPQEAARILAEAIDYARQGQVAATKAGGFALSLKR